VFGLFGQKLLDVFLGGPLDFVVKKEYIPELTAKIFDNDLATVLDWSDDVALGKIVDTTHYVAREPQLCEMAYDPAMTGMRETLAQPFVDNKTRKDDKALEMIPTLLRAIPREYSSDYSSLLASLQFRMHW